MSSAERDDLAQARLAFREAQRLTHTPPHNAQIRRPILALRLLSETIYWSLRALDKATDAKASTVELNGPVETLEQAIQNATMRLTEFTSDMSHGKQVTALFERLQAGVLTNLDVRDESLENELEHVAGRLLAEADRIRLGIERIWFERLLRVAVPLVVLVLTGLGLLFWRAQSQISADTRFPWKTSSNGTNDGCRSPRQGCENDHYFFHTRAQNKPWIEFDLKSRPAVSGVTITNRTDCHECSARAVPLVVELAGDDKDFQTVAVRKDDFVTWTAQFPRQHARYLRLRVEKQTPFHLKQVRIHR